MKIVINFIKGLLFLFCSLVLTSKGIAQQAPIQLNTSANAEIQLQLIEALIKNRDYRQAYSLIEVIVEIDNFPGYSIKQQADVLKYGIQVTFLLDLYTDLDRYLNDFYRFDSNFSADDISGTSPNLKNYINEFLQSKQTNLVFVGKQKTDLDNIPASVTVFTAEDIDRLGVRDFMDLIRLVPGITEIGDNNERMIGARGISSGTTTNDMLFLINGHRLNDNLTSSANPDFIAIESIHQVEILRGSGSTFYGPNAFSAVINVITKRGADADNKSISVQMQENDLRDYAIGDATAMVLNAEFGEKISNTQSFYAFAQINGSKGGLITYDQNNPAITTDSTRRFGREYVNRNGPEFQLLLNYVSGAFEMTANSQLINFRPSRTQTYELWENFDQDTLRNYRSRKDRRSFIHASYDFLKDREEDGYSLTMHLGFDHYGKFIPFNNGFNRISDGYLQGDELRQSARVEYSTTSFLTKKDKKSFTLIGAELNVNSWNYKYFIRNPNLNVIQQVGNRAFNAQNLPQNEVYAGFYTQTERSLANDNIKLSFGVRVNYHNVYATFKRFKWGEEYNPRLNLVWNNTEWLKAKIIYSSSFLAPPFLYRYGLPDGSQYNAVAELRSQAVSNGQFVLFGRLKGGFSYDFQVYQNQISNLIQRESVGYINLAEQVLIRGFEAEVKFKGTVKRTIDVNAFANYSTSEAFLFETKGDYSYFDGFSNSNLTKSGTDRLAFFPQNMIKMGINFVTKLQNASAMYSDSGGSNKILSSAKSSNTKAATLKAGMTMEYYGDFPVRANWDDTNNDGVFEEIATNETLLNGFNPIVNNAGYWLANAYIELSVNAFSWRIGGYNLGNQRALLPAQYYIDQMGTVSGEPTRLYSVIKYRF
jgi:outer membrane receptor protein involved in Fe transport